MQPPEQPVPSNHAGALRAEPKSGLWLRLQRYLWWVGLAVFAALIVWQHIRAGYSLPTPWPDESHFLWQAEAVADHLGLHTVELNPDRSVFWMPPGYMYLVGLVFFVFGAKLAVARTLSLVLLLVAFGSTAALLRRRTLPLLSLLFCGVVLMHPSFVAVGNVARPEALLLAVVCGGYLLWFSRHRHQGLAVLLLGPLVHPNGLFFLPPVLLMAAFDPTIRKQLRSIKLSGLIVLLVVLLFWLAYVIWVVANWGDFTHDIGFQIARKAGRDIWSSIFSPYSMLMLLLSLTLLIYGSIERLRSAALLAIAVPSWIIAKYGHEMWYEPWEHLAVLLILTALLHQAYYALTTRWQPRVRFAGNALFTVFAVFVLFFAHRSGSILRLSRYPTDQQWKSMSYQTDIPYLTATDCVAVDSAIQARSWPERPPRVVFLPRADCFLYPDSVLDRLKTIDPLFHKAPADLLVVHESRYLPHIWSGFIERDLKAMGRDSLRSSELVRKRDSTELWYLVAPDSTAHVFIGYP